MNEKRSDLWSAFAEHTVQRLGELVTSGEIGATDPLVNDRVEPFARGVPAGSFPVEVLLHSRKNDTRVALARVVFRAGTPASFEMATCAGQDLRTLRAEERFGYGVDSGTGCFADASARMDGAAILAAFEKMQSMTWSWAVAPDASYIAFSSGYGDGMYASYWALDSNGDVVGLVTDFNVLEIDKPEHVTDDAARREAADALFAQLSRGGDAWKIASELGALREAGAHLVPKLAAMMTKNDSEAIATALGGIVSTAAGADALTGVLHSLKGDALARVLAERRTSDPVPPACGDLLATRWEQTSSAALRLEILKTLGGTEPHPAFARIATHALRSGPSSEVISAAILPYRVRNGEDGPAYVAPGAYLDALASLTPKLDGYALDTLALQGRRDAVKPLLASRDPKRRAGAALALGDQPMLQALAETSDLDEDLRYDCAAHLSGAAARCAVYVKLGLAGSDSAVLQLRYMAGDDVGAVMDALATLAARAPSPRVREAAEKALEKVSKRAT